jgi:hypothetical protein
MLEMGSTMLSFHNKAFDFSRGLFTGLFGWLNKVSFAFSTVGVVASDIWAGRG